MPPVVLFPLQDVSLAPIRKHRFPTPVLRLMLHDLSHPGSSVLLTHVKAAEDLEVQTQNVLNLLYTPDSIRPGTRSVTFVVREFDGLAYTTGIDLDSDHKEIHFNLNYIKRPSEPRHELLGVLCHELVHCFQWNAEGTCPGGLIEGIADWVRLRAGLAARHWRQEADGNWDGGYQHTGFFLDYLDQRFGGGVVRRLNAELREGKYNEEKLFKTCCDGKVVSELWHDYKEALKTRGHTTSKNEGPAPAVPTHPSKVPRMLDERNDCLLD